jgi:hypothetical protein
VSVGPDFAERLRRLAERLRAAADECQALAELAASPPPRPRPGRAAVPPLAELRGLAAEELRARLRRLSVAVLEDLARAVGAPFTPRKTRKDDLVAAIAAQLRLEARMSAVQAASERSFRAGGPGPRT